MAKKKKERKASAVARSGWWISLALFVPGVAMFAGFAYLFLLSGRSAEEIILAKRTRAQVSVRFTPVLIYQSVPGAGARGELAGSGTLYEGKKGSQIVTAEHLFRKELGAKIFAFRKLRPLEEIVSHGIQEVLDFGTALGGPGQTPDVVILRVGRAASVNGFSSQTLMPTTLRMSVTRFNSPHRFIRSLVSGERVPIIGVARILEGGDVPYYIGDHRSIPGESGTGFIDQEEGLYVLKGQIVPSEEEWRFLRARHTALFFGPLKIRE